jgi:DNA-directed RNA polymerase subunit H (RpoH/RPB5)
MRYWKTYQKELIDKFMEDFTQQKYQLVVWQQTGSTRKQFNATYLQYNRQKSIIEISKKSLNTELELNPEKPIYAHIAGPDLIFKKEKYDYFNGRIEFTAPAEIQLYEKRKYERFRYQYQDHKDITFESEKQKVINQESQETEPVYVFSSVLLDISISGASFVINKNQYDQMNKGDHIFLNNVTDQQLPEPFKTTVRYIQPYGAREDLLFKVGIEFEFELDSISYKSITSIVERKQQKVKGIRPDQYCGLDYEEQVRTFYKIEAENPVLADNIRDCVSELDRLRYMTSQMKVEFLQTVSMDLLATALRLNSKELIYELFSELTETIQNEFLEKLAISKPASAINKAQDDILKVIRQKEASGEYILDPKAFVTYV